MTRSCKTCKYAIPYVGGGGDVIYYECRFNPPAINSYALQERTQAIRTLLVLYPKLQAEDWCYQYKAVTKR